MMSKGDRSLTSAKSLVVAYRSNQTSVLTKWSKIMKKLVIGTALILTALPFTFDGVTPAVSKAHAIIGRPLTPLSVAGMHRRAVRRTFGVGANLGYSGFYHRNFGPYAYNRLGYGYHPVARAAAYGSAAVVLLATAALTRGYSVGGYGGNGTRSQPSNGATK